MIWWLFKLTWQVNLTSYNLSSDLKRSRWARWQVKLSSWLVCQVELVTTSGICHVRKKIAGISRQILFWESLARRRSVCEIFGPFFACSSLSKSSVFGWARFEIWPWHNPPPAYFSRYKQSRSDTGSTPKVGTNKERRSSHQRPRTSQWSCWLWIAYMFPESKIFLPDENLPSFNLD